MLLFSWIEDASSPCSAMGIRVEDGRPRFPSVLGALLSLQLWCSSIKLQAFVFTAYNFELQKLLILALRLEPYLVERQLSWVKKNDNIGFYQRRPLFQLQNPPLMHVSKINIFIVFFGKKGLNQYSKVQLLAVSRKIDYQLGIRIQRSNKYSKICFQKMQFGKCYQNINRTKSLYLVYILQTQKATFYNYTSKQ